MSLSKDGKSLVTVSSVYRDAKIQVSINKQTEIVGAELKWWNTQSGEFVRRLPLGQEDIGRVEANWAPTGNLMALVEHYGRGHYVIVDQPGDPDRRPNNRHWVNVQDVYLRLLDAQSRERRVKVEGAEKSYYDQVTYIGRMGFYPLSNL